MNQRQKIIQIIKSRAKLRGENVNRLNIPSSIGSYLNGQPVYQFFKTLSDTDLSLKQRSIDVYTSAVGEEQGVPWHTHNFVEITIPLQGTCTVEAAHQAIELQPFDICIIGRDTPHKMKKLSSNDLVINISLRQNAFSLTELEPLINSSHYLSILVFVGNDHPRYSFFATHQDKEIDTTLFDILHEYYVNDEQSDQIIRLQILILISRLCRFAAHQPAQVFSKEQRQQIDLVSVLLYIERNYASVTLQKIADHFGYHPDYLTHQLKAQTGHSFIQLVKLQRLNVAVDYLVNTNVPIEKISLAVGYETPSYFYKSFKSMFGVTPRRYRQHNRN